MLIVLRVLGGDGIIQLLYFVHLYGRPIILEFGGLNIFKVGIYINHKSTIMLKR